MGTLQVLLWLGVTGYSIYSVIAYTGRRRGNKVALKSLLDDASPARAMSAEERTALEPFLLALGGKPMALVRDAGVFELTGPFVRHSLTTQGSTAEHNTLGGVDVLMPYDAMDFIDSYNQAEVVLTPKYAIVISLNGKFDLVGGRARALVSQREERQWQAGQPGVLPDACAVQPGDADPAADQATILGQRDETPAETLQRSRPGTGFLAALALLAAFAALAWGSRSLDGPSWAWCAPGLGLLALGAWLAWRRPALRAASKVNRVRGRIVHVLMTQPGNAVQAKLILGDKFAIEMPPHWAKVVRLDDAPVEVEMRVDDSSLVRYGRALSVDDEVRRSAPIYWGRPVWVALAAAASLALLVFASDNVRADFAQARSALRAGGVRELHAPQDVQSAPPASGDMVHARGDMRCSVGVDDAGAGLPAIDCTRVRWGAPPLVLAPYEPPAAVVPFVHGEVIGAHSDPMIDAIAAMRGGTDAVTSMALGRTPSVALIADVGRLVDQVEAVCPASNSPAGCAELRKSLISDVAYQVEPAPADWAALVKLRQSGKLVGEDNIAAVSGLRLRILQSEANDVAAGLMQVGMLGDLRKALPAHQPGVVDFTGVPLPAKAASDAEGASPSDDASEPLQRWQAYTDELGAQALRPREVSGMVVSSALQPDGRWTLDIDPTRQATNANAAVVRLALLAAALALLGVGIVQATLRLRAAGRRNRQLLADAAERVRSLGSF